ncbi:hypothetical protein G6321_00001820 (plasmid) [Bradyrhizobium barranii subsp. barranii]|uniref:Uncharacterized protein n=1 Tax=Bradyrhizobium barranii subsp. barranii TaxID=2823807 RepID=A0A7Z0TY60_9BRAD|nr:hypothetical protein [Bradyrhizobium barranii]UGX89530.1 hypothetical protein G6321_00001820 [Bradyrhizobium barranii subsp. barranii]
MPYKRNRLSLRIPWLVEAVAEGPFAIVVLLLLVILILAGLAAAVFRTKQVVAVASVSCQGFAIAPFIDGAARFLAFSGALAPLQALWPPFAAGAVAFTEGFGEFDCLRPPETPRHDRRVEGVGGPRGRDEGCAGRIGLIEALAKTLRDETVAEASGPDQGAHPDLARGLNARENLGIDIDPLPAGPKADRDIVWPGRGGLGYEAGGTQDFGLGFAADRIHGDDDFAEEAADLSRPHRGVDLQIG